MSKAIETDTPQKLTWHIESIPCPRLGELINSWYLDTPKQGDSVAEVDVIQVSGWALASADRQSRLHLVIRFRNRTLSYPLNQVRADVVDKVLGVKPEDSSQLQCGFTYPVTTEDAVGGFEIGFEIDGYIYEVAKISVD
jgi:hypothetical protein